ncbi:MAG TPA: VanZ family protein [Verrucomicrobiae bacterium]
MSAHRLFLIYWLPVVVWMALIFSASTDAGSSRRTSRIIRPILRWLYPQISDARVEQVQFVVRKGGHMAEYAILAGLLWRARRKPVPHDPRPWQGAAAVFAWLVAALYACSDELHQNFVASRQASVWDVMLDSTGAALGLIALWQLGRWRKRW